MANASYDNTTLVLHRDYETTTVSSNSKPLSPAAIVFIVLGVVVAVGLLVWLFFHYYRRKHSKTPAPPPIAKPIPVPTPPIVATLPLVAGRRPAATLPPIAKPKPVATPRAPPTPVHNFICRKPLCQEYLKGLHLPSAYFRTRFDSCFCRKCHDPKNVRQKCGEICTPFHTWTRFGLSLDEAFGKQNNIFRSKAWQTSFYGTSSTKLKSILHDRWIPLDGDQLGGGETFRSEHPNPKVCTTFSTLARASDNQFAKFANFTASDGNNYRVQVVFQCKQKMDTVTMNGEEMTTCARNSIVPYGLLVRLQKTS